MNIFVVSYNPRSCAVCLDDIRLNKMIVETGQLLSTAYRMWYGQRGPIFTNSLKFKEGYPYCLPDELVLESYYRQGLIDLASYINHPCTVWARQKPEHYAWLWLLMYNMLEEYTFRFDKQHSNQKKLTPLAQVDFPVLGHRLWKQVEHFIDCSGQPENDWSIYDRYKECLRNKWSNDTIKLTWTNRLMPEWVL